MTVDDRLRLEPLVSAHVDVLDPLIRESRSELAPWMPWAAEYRGAEDLRAFVAGVESRRAVNPAETAFAIFLDSAAVGTIGLHAAGAHNLYSVGYWLGTRYTGRGIMTRAVDRVAEFAFDAHGIHRLELYTVVDNEKSRRVAERAGFIFEGILRNRLELGGRYLDAALYARFPKETLV